MGKLIAIAGGDLDSTQNLNQYIVSLAEKPNPKLLFIPTASGDANGYIDRIRHYFGRLGCAVEALCLISDAPDDKTIASSIQEAEIIYVGGGDTVKMMEIWRKHKVDQYLLRAYQEGKIVSGISAGAICWFAYGHSDSESNAKEDWSYVWARGLGIFPVAFCPHYNEEDRKSFDAMLLDLGLAGLALEDHTAFVELDGKIEIRKENPDAKAFYMVYQDGSLIKRELREGSIENGWDAI